MDLIKSTEKALIGALLLSQKKLPNIVGIVKPEDFTTVTGAISYGLIVDLWQKNRSIDVLSVANGDPSLIEYLSSSTGDTCVPAALEYANIIAEAGKVRRIKKALSRINSGPAKPEPMLEDLLSLYQQEMKVGKKKADIADVLTRFETHVSENLHKGSMGFATGFRFLQRLHVEYVPGHIWTIGGYTSVGKTAVMIQKIRNLIALQEAPSILVISTEMTEEQVVARILANFTGVHSSRIISGQFRDEDEERLVEEYKILLKKVKLSLYDDIYTLDEVEVAFRKADLQGGVNVGFVDYVQNIRIPKAKNSYAEQSEIARRLQSLAKDVRATIICLSQVSNDVGRGNTDQLELKGAGEWAAVSDVGVMLKRSKTENFRLKYEIKKNRHGALDEMVLEYMADYTRLKEKTGESVELSHA